MRPQSAQHLPEYLEKEHVLALPLNSKYVEDSRLVLGGGPSPQALLSLTFDGTNIAM